MSVGRRILGAKIKPKDWVLEILRVEEVWAK